MQKNLKSSISDFKPGFSSMNQNLIQFQNNQTDCRRKNLLIDFWQSL